MRSMTGFGRTQFNFQTSVITIEVTSINKRNFEVLLHGPREWHSFEIPASKVVSKKIERGRIRINVSIAQNDITSTKAIDLSVVEEDVKSLQSVMQRLGLDSKVCSNTIIELYKIRRSEISELPPLAEITTLLENQLVKAIDNLLTMKSTEGEKLYEDMSNRLTRLEKITQSITKKSSGMARDWRDRLMQRLNHNDLDLDLNDERVLKEMSIFSEKCDISEEITRIESHLGQLTQTIQKKGSIGRQVEFLLQEVSRELNTICSKSASPGCTKKALEGKVEVEKLREQAMNVE